MDMFEDEEQASDRYLNGLQFQIEDELVMVMLHSVVDEAFQYALKGGNAVEAKDKSRRRKGLVHIPSINGMENM